MSQNPPSVSVVLPVYNEIKLIRKCLKSLSSQSVQPFEIIVVDNNSSDGSIDIAREFDNVRVVSEPRQGIIYARYGGFNSAKGDIIATLDADSVVAPDWIERIGSHFQEDPKLLALGGVAGCAELSPPGMFVGSFAYNMIAREADARRYGLEVNQILYGHNMAFRRSAWLEMRDSLYLGPDRQESIEDVEMSAKFATMGKTAIDPKLVVNIHVLRFMNYKKLKRYRELGVKAVQRRPR